MEAGRHPQQWDRKRKSPRHTPETFQRPASRQGKVVRDKCEEWIPGAWRPLRSPNPTKGLRLWRRLSITYRREPQADCPGVQGSQA